jgi:site-specific recombinase XerD
MSRRRENVGISIHNEWISPVRKVQTARSSVGSLEVKCETLNVLMDAFFADRLSPSTRRVYSSYIRALFDAVGKRDLEEITPDDVLTYRDKLIGNFDPVTIASRLNVLRNFCQFCVDSGLLERNPVEDVKPPKTLEYNSAVRLTEDQVEMLLRQPNRLTVVGKRDYALLCLMIYNGLLASEIANIRWGDLQWKGDHIILRFCYRGRKDATSRIKPYLMEAIMDYKEACNKVFDKTTQLFTVVEANTETDTQKPISTGIIRGIVKKYAKMADLKKPVSPETLRRTYKVFSHKWENLDT